MEIKAQSRFVRITPRKARLVAGAVRHLPLEMALSTLDRLNKRAARYIKNTIESGIANAENNAKVSRASLSLKKLDVDEGPRFKRWRAASRGMAHPYAKNTSHITVILESRETAAKKQIKKAQEPKQQEPMKLVKEAPKKELAESKPIAKQQKMKSQQTKSKGVTTRKIIGG